MTAPTTERRAEAPTATTAMSDVEYLVYALVQMVKTFLALAGKRWPHIR